MRKLQFSSVSVPWDKNTLCSESIFSSGNVLGEYFTIVSDMSLKVVDKEWLSEVILVVSVWHGFEIKSHWSTWFNISDFVGAGGGVGVSVEEFSGNVIVLWEEWILSSFVPLLIVIDDMVGFWSEESVQFLVGEDGIKEIDLINGWLSTLISNSSGKGKSSNEEMDFPNESLWSHQETESGISS